MKAKVKCERSVIESLMENGMKGSREWYKFMRSENVGHCWCGESETE